MSFHRVSPRRCLFTEYLNLDYVNGNQDMSSFENILPFRNAKNLKPETSKFQSVGRHLDGHIIYMINHIYEYQPVPQLVMTMGQHRLHLMQQP